MKKFTFIILAFIAFSMPIISQQKKKVVKPEIDRLADKYKNDSLITIYSAGNELNCTVSVCYNSDNKPVEVIMYGNNKSKYLIAEVLANLVIQKIKSGYKPCDFESSLAIDKSYIINNLIDSSNKIDLIKVCYKFTKGKMIFKIEGGNEICGPDYNFYWFNISTIDNGRVGGHKATKLDI
ncbi:MAG: hypothetical protein PHR83_13930 [Paludibacter sp.]|nr:hypothetical protein [Paludibacter sp.]